MGQTHSDSVHKEPVLLQIDANKVRFEEYMNPRVQERPWTGIFCESTPNILEIHNTKWRKDVISQLKSIDLPGWPRELVKVLKRTKRNQYSHLYQTELFWVDSHYALVEERNSSSQLEAIKKIENYLNDPINSSRDEYILTRRSSSRENSSSPQVMDKAVKELLDNSEIIDDRIFSTPTTQLRHAKSLHLKSSEGLEKVGRLSLGYLRPSPGRVKVKSIENDSCPKSEVLEMRKPRKTPPRFTEAYKANMLSNQVPFANGMDGRSINDINDLYQAVRKFKVITSLIEKHVSQEAHVFNQLIAQFERCFVKRYNVDETCPVSEDGYDGWSEKATVDLQQFIIIMYEALDRFYCMENLVLGRLQGHDTIFNRNNMINFVTSMIFTAKIHKTLFDLYALQAAGIEVKYKRNLRSCRNLKPQDFDVSQEYCLNDMTIRYLNKAIHSRGPSIDLGILGQNCEKIEEETYEKVIQEENSSDCQTPSMRNLSLVTKKDGKAEIHDLYQDLHEEEGTIPYEKAITAMHNLLNKNSPIQKIKVIIKVAELMNEAVEEFYKNMGDKAQEKLNGDETFAVFMYIVARSQLANLITHCKIIEKFSTSNILTSMSGYYVMTLKACVNYICTMNLPENFTVEQFGASMREFKSSMACFEEKDENEEVIRNQ